MTFLNNLGDAEVANFDTLLAVEQNVVQFDISMDHRTTMDVRESINDLFEDELAVLLLQTTSLLYESQKVTTASVLHHHE